MRVTVGLSPSSRHIGIAVLHKDKLIAWRIQSFPGKWSEKKQRAILQALHLLFASYNIEGISVKIPDEFPKAVSYSQLIGLINRLCESYAMTAKYYTLSDIKRYFSDNPKVNKQSIVAFLVYKYPELRSSYNKEQTKRSKSFSRIVEAIAVSLCTVDQ